MSLRKLNWGIAGLLVIVLPSLGWAGQPQPPASPFKGEYFVTRSQGAVCVPFARNLNQFRRLDFDVCHPRLSEKYPQFTRPAWEEIPFDLSVAETIIRNVAARGQGDPYWTGWLTGSEPLRAEGKITLWRTRIDIDGDGAPETILRLYAPLRAAYRPGGTMQWGIDPNPCVYRHNTFYLLESPNDGTRENFNRSAFIMADIIIGQSEGRRDEYYALDRSTFPSLDGLNIGPRGK